MARKRKNPIAHVAGAEELERAMNAVGDRVGGLLLRDAAEDGAKIIAAEASRLAPKDSGDLAAGIGTAIYRRQTGRTRVNISFGKEEWYGRLVELGSENMAAQPFLRPALDAKQQEATDAVGKALWDALDGVL